MDGLRDYVSSDSALRKMTGIDDLGNAEVVCLSRELLFSDPEKGYNGFVIRASDMVIVFRQASRPEKATDNEGDPLLDASGNPINIHIVNSSIACYDDSGDDPDELFKICDAGDFAEVEPRQMRRIKELRDVMSTTGKGLSSIVQDMGNVNLTHNMLDILIDDDHHFFPRHPNHLANIDAEAYLADMPCVVEYVRNNGYAPVQLMLLEGILGHLARTYGEKLESGPKI